jgi:hypothetical protein
MFDKENLALGGLFPGLVTTNSIANLGTFTVEVIIQPVVSNGGGGWVPVSRGQRPDRYLVTVKITYDGETYETSKVVDDDRAKIDAKLNGITEFTPEEVMVSINGVQVTNKSKHTVSISLNNI